MGTDITCFIEYALDGNHGPFFTAFAEVFLPRDYTLFGALAGVRGETTPLYAPRGFPRDASASAEERHYVWVIDPASETEWKGEPFMPRDEAEQLIARGFSYSDAARDRLAHPDWQEASWLTLAEVREALAHSQVELASCSPEFTLTMQICEQLDRTFPLGCRLVFWFSS
jgi:hypothetical protein